MFRKKATHESVHGMHIINLSSQPEHTPDGFLFPTCCRHVMERQKFGDTDKFKKSPFYAVASFCAY